MKNVSSLLCSSLLIYLLLIACQKDVDVAIPDQSFVEEFGNYEDAIDSGWVFINGSVPANDNRRWQEGSLSGSITAYSPKGSFNNFISANYESTSAGQGIISNWAISPTVTLQNGDKIIFYTRALVYPERDFYRDFVNRLQLRLNTRNNGTDVGSGTSVGSFDVLLLDINPEYEEYNSDPEEFVATAYPSEWTRFEATIAGLAKPIDGRFAFRYLLEEGGEQANGSEVAIDSVAYVSISRK